MKILTTIILIFTAVFYFSPKTVASGLTDAEKEGIQLMREEEKLAHDVYKFLNDKWNFRVFANITNAEKRHFDAIGYLLENFEIEDVALSEPGKFTNKDIAFLYDSLTQKGSESIVEALKVGAFIEEFDIADLQKLLAANNDSVVAGVYENLLRGSNNHLRAFTRQLANRNETYTPVILSQAVYTEIVTGEHQPGNMSGNCIVPGKKKPMGRQNRRCGGKHGYRGGH